MFFGETPYQLIQGQAYVAELDQTGSDAFRCTASHDDHSATATITGTGSAAPSSQISLVLKTAGETGTAEFHWLMMVSSP